MKPVVWFVEVKYDGYRKSHRWTLIRVYDNVNGPRSGRIGDFTFLGMIIYLLSKTKETI